MKHFGKILVAVEPSNVFAEVGDVLTRPSQHALDRAIWLASQTGAGLTIFSTVAISPFIENLLQEQLRDNRDEPMHATRELLERCVAQAQQKGVAAISKVTVGIPWEEICRYVQSEGHDIVIAGTRDLGRVSRIVFGSTGVKLLRNCPAPVWISRPGLSAEQLEILVPTDFSDASIEALRLALEIGQVGHACVHLLHVLGDPLSLPIWDRHVSPQMVEDYIAKRRAQFKKRLHDQLAQAGDRSPGVGAHVHVIEGAPDDAILQAIDDLNINLVVMGTAARSGLARVALGNTTERLISHMRCSLVAVKPPGFRCPLISDSETVVHPPMSPARTF